MMRRRKILASDRGSRERSIKRKKILQTRMMTGLPPSSETNQRITKFLKKLKGQVRAITNKIIRL